ncbi:hypothetical protein STENM327S_09226 [Streptomyces tendae]
MSNGERRPRTVDLARAAGLSTQQVRNYEDAGVLPPAGRTDAGYRIFGERHRDALLTYRALRPGYGAVTATRVMRAVHDGDAAAALALVDAAHAALHEERMSLRAAGEALEALALGTDFRPTSPDLYSIVSYVDARDVPGAAHWPDQSAYALLRVSYGDQVCAWVTRLPEGLWFASRYPDTDVAHKNLRLYVERLRDIVTGVGQKPTD